MFTEGKAAARTHDCKYIEVSAAIDHKIDELLVGILQQIRLTRKRTQHRKTNRSRNHSLLAGGSDETTCCLLKARDAVLQKLLGSAKSCDNLYVP